MMLPATVDRNPVTKFPSLAEYADDLRRIGSEYQDFTFPPFNVGARDYRALSWRCRALAYANMMRGQELLRFAILAINEGALLTACVLTRALDETLAVVVGARRKIAKTVTSRDENRMIETINRLTCGNRFMSAKDDRHPKSY